MEWLAGKRRDKGWKWKPCNNKYSNHPYIRKRQLKFSVRILSALPKKRRYKQFSCKNSESLHTFYKNVENMRNR